MALPPIDPGDCFAMIAPFVLRMEITPLEEDEEGWTGTCFILGKRNKTGQLIAATVKHNIPDGIRARWVVQRFKQKGSIDFQAMFVTGPEHMAQSVFVHKALDVGWFLIPPQFSAAFRPTDRFPTVIDQRQFIGEGSVVSWCGYPRQVERFLGRPQLCHFGGSISASIDSETPSYLVDGHVARGVSGGPIWYCCDEKRCPVIVGLVRQFVHEERTSEGVEVPGFCVTEWIQPIMGYFKWWNEQANLKTGDPAIPPGPRFKFPYELP